MLEGYRSQRARLHANCTGLGWTLKLGLAIGMAGFVALTAQLSIPLPWTPVPFSLGLVGVLLTGAVLGRAWGLLSIAIYILAGALGLRVFADQASTGPQVLTGFTSGYIYGYAAAAALVGWYVEQRRRLLDRRWAMCIAIGLGALGLLSLLALTGQALSGPRFTSSYAPTQAYLGLFVVMSLLAAAAAYLLVQRSSGLGREKLNLFLVMVAAIALIHACGVAVLKATLGYPWSEAIALGSTVFLPFDLVKAALATGATLLFLPTRDDEMPTMPKTPVNP
ncbi:MAG TPA: biotin transporter BioY [Candidatus Thermoplasmatota archaeon]|nr:biotin transporter BioY [Candidatus Thermoplasmatota archaeon]